VIDYAGTIVSFNGDGIDMPELSKILGLPSEAHLMLKGIHRDMMPIISAIRWPPYTGTAPINGPSLTETYQHCFGNVLPSPPSDVTDAYEISNWRDCKMPANLWIRWQRDELARLT
jgi:hypothetical protein